MREIKFEFIYGCHTGDRQKRVWSLEEISKRNREYSVDDLWGDDYTVIARRQYTGLKDKNGKEIYEGDIVEIELAKWMKSQYEVHWNNDHAGFSLIHAKREGDDWGVYKRNISLNEPKEIIGNIHENPELIP